MGDFRIRASSISELFDCGARWEAKHILGIRMPSSPPAHLGTSIHASTAVFDKARLEGSPVTVDDAAGEFIDTLHNPTEEVDWSDSDLTIKKAEQIGLQLHSRYCAEIAPHQDYVAVEMTCEALDISFDEDLTITLTGTTDRVRRLPDGTLGIADLKSGGRAVGADGVAVTKGHAPQIGIYNLLAEFALGRQIDGDGQIVGLQTSGKARVGTGIIENPKAALIGSPDTPGLLEYAAAMLKHGIFPGNAKSYLCSQKYCPIYATCAYK